MSGDDLRRSVEELAESPTPLREQALPVIEALLEALAAGSVRAAEPGGGGWVVNGWVKQGILLGFRCGRNVEIRADGGFHFRDRDTFPTWSPAGSSRDVRIVPGGSTVRRGAFVGDGVVIMPPAYVNVGAYVGQGTLVDSHALVGSCAQIGRGVHLSAAAQIGGVLEPIGALPVIVEDNVFVGGGCGIYEGARVGRGAVLAPGVVLTRAVTLYDLVHDRWVEAGAGESLVVPERAVVVPGSRPARAPGASRGIQLQLPVIVKYRDDSTDAALVLEEALR